MRSIIIYLAQGKSYFDISIESFNQSQYYLIIIYNGF
jgi:hypothetical protein